MSDTPTEKAIGIWEELEPRAENFWRLVRKNAPTHEIIREAQRQLEKMTDLAIYAESPELMEDNLKSNLAQVDPGDPDIPHHAVMAWSDYLKIKEGGEA